MKQDFDFKNSILLNGNNLREICIDNLQNNIMALSELLHYEQWNINRNYCN